MSQTVFVAVLVEILSKNFKCADHHADCAIRVATSTATWDESADLSKFA
jgi:hypothetical protein